MYYWIIFVFPGRQYIFKQVSTVLSGEQVLIFVHVDWRNEFLILEWEHCSPFHCCFINKLPPYEALMMVLLIPHSESAEKPRERWAWDRRHQQHTDPRRWKHSGHWRVNQDDRWAWEWNKSLVPHTETKTVHNWPKAQKIKYKLALCPIGYWNDFEMWMLDSTMNADLQSIVEGRVLSGLNDWRILAYAPFFLLVD